MVAVPEVPLISVEEVIVSIPAEVSAGAADDDEMAKVAVVEVTAGGAVIPVGTTGEVAVTVGASKGEVEGPDIELILEILFVEPWPCVTLCRGL